MIALDFILFEISIQLELIYKKYFILIRNSFENEIKKAKFDFDDGCVHPHPPPSYPNRQNLGRSSFNRIIQLFIFN